MNFDEEQEMCLDKVTREYEVPGYKVEEKWKVFATSLDEDPYFLFFSLLKAHFPCRTIPLDRWLLATQCRCFHYDTGFHVFATKKKAEDYLRCLAPMRSAITKVWTMGKRLEGVEKLTLSCTLHTHKIEVVDWMLLAEEDWSKRCA